MVVGKPNFNLNSFGIEYFVKREGEKIGNKKELGESKQLTDRGTRSSRIDVPNASSTSGIKPRPHPKLFGQARESIDGAQTGRKFSEKPSTPLKPTNETVPNPQTREPMEGGTRSFFNSPTYGVKPYKPKIETEGKQEHIGSIIGEKNTDKVQGMDEKGNKRSISNISERTEDEPKNNKGNKISESQTGGKKPSKLADAPQNVKGEEVKVSQKKIRVGVGEKAHEEMVKRDGVGEKRYAADPKSPYSEQSEKRREREDLKSRKLRYAQSEVNRLQRNQQTQKLGKSNEIIRDINILKLDLNKVPRKGTKDYKAQQRDSTEYTTALANETFRKARHRLGHKNNDRIQGGINGNLETSDNPSESQFYSGYDSGSEESSGRFTNAIVNAPKAALDIMQAGKKVKKSADETIFKAILLKLDLMKVGIKGERYVRENRQGASKNPATRLPNAGGIQNKLETMQNESPTLTAEDIKRQKRDSETGATGESRGSVASRYD